MRNSTSLPAAYSKHICGDVWVQEREAELKSLQEQLAQVQPELNRIKAELQEKGNLEEQLRQQIADKEEKTKKAFMGAKQKINQLNS